LTWTVLKDKVISKFAPPWNFKLTWTVHKDEMISKFAPPWNFKLTWTVYKGNRISKFPPGGPSNLPKDLIKIPTPMKLQIDMKCPHGENLFPSMQKLSRFTIQKLPWFRKHCDSETSAATIPHTRLYIFPLGNCCDSDTVEIQGSCGNQRLPWA